MSELHFVCYTLTGIRMIDDAILSYATPNPNCEEGPYREFGFHVDEDASGFVQMYVTDEILNGFPEVFVTSQGVFVVFYVEGQDPYNYMSYRNDLVCMKAREGGKNESFI